MGKITDYARKQRSNPTESEKQLWEYLKGKKIYGKKFLRQKPIIYKEIEGNKYFFIADFCCYNPKLIIEVDGGIHKANKDYDAERDKLLKDSGFIILRFSNEQVLENTTQVISKISLVVNSDPSLIFP
ncbi:MAG: DUF559 domain-containing protein [Chitinophagales bacterium]|nr:DUF559 domain-containing protein [Chitinophagales bacterium]